tara:strand:- start:1557 stop:1994 length:438 start_codon:yes stop_codon:yes gene_type:complete
MILVVKINENELHDYEFVKPITMLLDKFRVVHYKDIKEGDLDVDKVIICGTSLKDCKYLEDLDKFSWLKEFRGKVLGICGGMQIIGKILGNELEENKRIGLMDNKYFLHSFKVKGFDDVLEVDNFIGVLFHPEVRNGDVIEEFVK